MGDTAARQWAAGVGMLLAAFVAGASAAGGAASPGGPDLAAPGPSRGQWPAPPTMQSPQWDGVPRLCPDPDGRVAAVLNALGRQRVVVRLTTPDGRQTMRLEAGGGGLSRWQMTPGRACYAVRASTPGPDGRWRELPVGDAGDGRLRLGELGLLTVTTGRLVGPPQDVLQGTPQGAWAPGFR